MPAPVVLSADQKAKVRHHCGYLGVSAAATFALGAPAAVETQFIIEQAMNKLLAESVPQLENLVGVCDAIEAQMVGDLELLAVNQIGEIAINQDEQKQLVARYDYWVDALCNLLGVERNPFDKRLTGRGRGLNVRVQG